MNKDASLYIAVIPEEDVRQLAHVALKRLMEIGEVSFRTYDQTFQNEVVKECFFWDSCGKNLLND